MLKFLILLLAVFSFSNADTLHISSPINSLDRFSYESPHGKKLKIPHTIKTVVVSYEKDTGRLVNNYLNNKYPPYLAKMNAIFIADIHEMPSIITKLFALPKMRKYKHTIYLNNKENFSKFLPPKDEKITIIKFENQKVKSIKYISTVKELKEAFEH